MGTVDGDPIDALRSQLLALNDDNRKSDRMAASRMFISMSELFDTALIRTPGMVDQLWDNPEKRERTLYDNVRPYSQLEELLVLNATLVSCVKDLQPLNQALLDAVVASFRKCGQQLVPEAKIHDKSQMLYNQLMRETNVLNACFCSSDSEAKSLFTAACAGSFAKYKLSVDTMEAIQERIASGARARGVFAVGGVDGYSSEHFDTTAELLEPSEYLHQSISNLVLHVAHMVKDHIDSMPKTQQIEFKMDIFKKLWPDHRQRVSATACDVASKAASTLNTTAVATSEVVRHHFQGLLSASTVEELTSQVKAKLKDLLAKFQKILTPDAKGLNSATHIVAVHA